MGKIIFAFSLVNFLCSVNCLAQEIDPLERSQNGISYSDRSVRYDTTKSYYVNLVFRVINYNGKPAETLYNRYVDLSDKQSGTLVKRVDIQQVLRKAGFKTIEGRDHTKTYFVRCAVNDHFVAFSGKDGGMVAVDIRTDQIVYNHKNREDSVWPFWANEEFSMATIIEKRTSEDGFDKSSYALFDKNFKIVAKISYNLNIGKHGHIKSGIMLIPSSNEFYNQVGAVNYIEINLGLLSKINSLQANNYTTEDHGVSIGSGLIRIRDSGVIVVKVKGVNGEFYFDKFNGGIVLGSIPDGTYDITWSDYLETDKPLSIVNGQISIAKPYFKSNESENNISFKYQGFNYSHSGLTDTLGLEIIFYY
jgi:hypothetical protein